MRNSLMLGQNTQVPVKELVFIFVSTYLSIYFYQSTVLLCLMAVVGIKPGTFDASGMRVVLYYHYAVSLSPRIALES